MKYHQSTELCHHGIKGQKWGVRRFQNKDGTLTPTGRNRLKAKSNDSETGEDDKAFIEKYKKQIIAGIVVAGVAAGVGIAYKQGLFDNIHLFMGSKAPGDNVLDENVLEKAKQKTIKEVNKAVEEINPNDLPIPNQEHLNEAILSAKRNEAFTLEPGTDIKRQVSIKNWDPRKSNGPLFVSFTERDAKVYRERLTDWNKTGERYEVSMKLQKTLNVPSKATVREIVDNLYEKDPKFRKEVMKTQYKNYISLYTDLYPSRTPSQIREMARQEITDHMSSSTSAFNTAMYSMVKKRKDSKILSKELQKQGYNAIIDYFDKEDGFMGQTPLIILDKSTLVKTGEEFVGRIVKDKLVKE